MTSPVKFLVIGANGWIGGMLVDMLKAQGKEVGRCTARIEDRAALLA
jgi:nucleoside-diphosphate-sugar epimerase